MELSELVTFNGRIYTFDDRTGIVFELVNDKVAPWVILTDGETISEKGFKSEWATVKNNQLYVGSMGKEWTNGAGDFENYNPMVIFYKLYFKSSLLIFIQTVDGQSDKRDWRSENSELGQELQSSSYGAQHRMAWLHDSRGWRLERAP